MPLQRRFLPPRRRFAHRHDDGVARRAARQPRERLLVGEVVQLGARIARRPLGAVEHDHLGDAADAPLQIARHLFEARAIVRAQLHDVLRCADAFAAVRCAVGHKKLDRFLRLHVARSVGVVIVEKSAADVGAGGSNPPERGRIVLIGDDKQKFREREVRADGRLAVAHASSVFISAPGDKTESFACSRVQFSASSRARGS